MFQNVLCQMPNRCNCLHVPYLEMRINTMDTIMKHSSANVGKQNPEVRVIFQSQYT